MFLDLLKDFPSLSDTKVVIFLSYPVGLIAGGIIGYAALPPDCGVASGLSGACPCLSCLFALAGLETEMKSLENNSIMVFQLRKHSSSNGQKPSVPSESSTRNPAIEGFESTPTARTDVWILQRGSGGDEKGCSAGRLWSHT